MTIMQPRDYIGLSQKFLGEAIGHQNLSARAEEQAAGIVRVYTHLMAMAIERDAPSDAYDDMMIAIQELTTPRAYSFLRATQPHAAEALLALKASSGQFEKAHSPELV